MMDTRLAKQSVIHHAVFIEDVQDGVGVFGEGGGENDDFVDFRHAFEKGVDVRSFEDVDVVDLGFDLDGDDEIGVWDGLTSASE
jgi:hypothetical protein